MKIRRPAFSYYGGKWRLAAKYPTPRHSTIVEPFAGAAGYSLRHHHHDVVLVDKSEVIANIIAGVICLHPSAAWEDRAIALVLLAAIIATTRRIA